MNYFGYCGSKLKFPSDEEKIIAVLMFRGTSVTFEKNGHRYTTLPFESEAELLRLNPGCCSVGTENFGGDPTWSFWDRIFGFFGGNVFITFNAPYLDENGQRLIHTAGIIGEVDNCGKVY